MVFLPGLAQIYQLREILQRALDLGWTEMLIPLPFQGPSSREDVEAVLSDPLILASSGKYPLGQNKSLFSPESFEMFSAPHAFQELWVAHREPRFARSCIVCTNVAESGITIPNVGLVVSLHRCKNRRHRECAPNLVQSTITTAAWLVWSNRLWSSHNDDEPRSIFVPSTVR